MRWIRRIPIIWIRHHGPVEINGVKFHPKGPARVLIGYYEIDETPEA